MRRGIAAAIATVCTIWNHPAGAADLAGPAQVIDGDTIKIDGPRVRLHGIDAPEGAQTCLADGDGVALRPRHYTRARARDWSPFGGVPGDRSRSLHSDRGCLPCRPLRSGCSYGLPGVGPRISAVLRRLHGRGRRGPRSWNGYLARSVRPALGVAPGAFGSLSLRTGPSSESASSRAMSGATASASTTCQAGRITVGRRSTPRRAGGGSARRMRREPQAGEDRNGDLRPRHLPYRQASRRSARRRRADLCGDAGGRIDGEG